MLHPPSASADAAARALAPELVSVHHQMMPMPPAPTDLLRAGGEGGGNIDEGGIIAARS